MENEFSPTVCIRTRNRPNDLHRCLESLGGTTPSPHQVIVGDDSDAPQTMEEIVKLVVFSHACVTPVNQGFYADVEKFTGWTIELVLPAHWSNTYSSRITPTRWPGLKAKIHLTPTWKSGNVPLHVYRSWFRGLLKISQPDAIYVHHEPYGLATAQVYLANAATSRVPIGFYAAQNINKRYPLLFRSIEAAVYNRSGFAFPVTKGALSVLHEKGYVGPAQVLPLAIDSSVYRPRKSEADSLRAKLGIGADEFVIGYLGRLVEEKGLESLIRSCARLGHMQWRCIIVGSGPEEEKLNALTTQLGLSERVLFAGYVKHEDAPIWLSLFDVLVLPSETRPHWKEQFGRVLLEANACGTPVIGSDCGEIPAVIQETGGGVVVPEGNTEQLAEALEKMITNPVGRFELAASGQRTVAEGFNQPHLASIFASTIEKSVASSGRKV